MSDIRKLLNIISETTAGATSSGGVATVAQSMHETQRRVGEDYTQESTDTPQAPQILEYGNWENSALATGKKLKAARKKASKIVKSVYGEDSSGQKQSVSESASSVAGDSLNEGQYEMMLRNGQVKKFVAKDDADAKRIAAGHGAKSVIRLRGGVPAGKVSEQGVAEGKKLPYLVKASDGHSYKHASLWDVENEKYGSGSKLYKNGKHVGNFIDSKEGTILVRPDGSLWTKNWPYTGDDPNIRYDFEQGVAEASNPAQQAAIAINMKRKGVKPKTNECIFSDNKPVNYGLSYKQIDTLCEFAGSNYDLFDANIRKNMNLLPSNNTLELYGYYRSCAKQNIHEAKSNNVQNELFKEFASKCSHALDSAKVGDAVALLHLQSIDVPGDKLYVRLYGFTTLKKIVSIIPKSSYKQLKFDDGSIYPENDSVFLTELMQSLNMTKLFDSEISASKVATDYLLSGNQSNSKLDFKIKLDTDNK